MGAVIPCRTPRSHLEQLHLQGRSAGDVQMPVVCFPWREPDGKLSAPEPFFHPEEIPMRVNPRDGRCRSCRGELEIIDADDDTMTVECQNPDCCDSYLVETDAFRDGAMHYHPLVLASMLERREE